MDFALLDLQVFSGYKENVQDIVIPDSGSEKEEATEESMGPSLSEFVKVKFSKFVQLVASHDFEEVMKDRGEEEVLVSPNLLTDLANAHEEASGDTRKLPVMFLIGIILGIIITYLVMQF